MNGGVDAALRVTRRSVGQVKADDLLERFGTQATPWGLIRNALGKPDLT